MDDQEKQELLDAAVAAHREYVEGVQALRKARQEAFLAASRTAIKNREIAEATDLHESMVSRIARGQA
ncbi:hypothetical protein [Corynebacterium pseudopelargi]|uniref:Uncharacterized protein n=1 Tax=Corynebacterium pseudopelargi TaxID=2080757 RepID=A0A3G6ISE3_9CORY|nr:hypothetical protein [Corynebacterium pseudopelargi]AZA08506.1 hypothetical protein CPPEL_01800 [Corynebacterium pseudopelargi]